ncbi:uncharacterized protein BX664DRAFT_267716, partial [Halteromyces radiatus]|uniref:uncharacterized protein n=1 Tax=Halteromyces radiatus TaxID=101107 RepID=UPI00221FEF96
DHVYLTPEHLGEPYYIGRIMEFCKVRKRKGLQVRVAWYNRPKDVFNRRWYDANLLIATMNSDLNPVSSIRGKCTVLHKHYIPKDQFELYRNSEDHFYYTQLYDRYMQRVYDLLPCELVQNVPMDVREALCQRYQFIIVEQGKAADLTSARRICCVCQNWCNSASSVKCAGCQKSYHMTCLSPPLTRKPSKGFAWQCAFCSKKEIEELSKSSSTSSTSSSHGNEESSQSSSITLPSSSTSISRSSDAVKRIPRLRSQQQQRQQQQQNLQQQQKQPQQQNGQSTTEKISDPSQVRTTHMWPFRYFGVNTNIKDILDIDDRIYPRAASRIGAKYQATVPDWKEPSDYDTTSSMKQMTLSPSSTPPLLPSISVINTSSLETSSPSNNTTSPTKRLERRGRPSKRKDAASPSRSISDDSLVIEDDRPVIRGTDDTVVPLFSQPNRLNEDELDTYISKVQSLPNLPFASYSSDAYDLALSMLEENMYDTNAALNKIRQVTKDDFSFLVTWQADEIQAFEQSIREHGHELLFVKQRIPTKSMADIVRFFYQWKKSDRYEPVYSVWTKVFRPTKRFKKHTRSIMDYEEDDTTLEFAADPTVVPSTAISKNNKPFQCLNCNTTHSTFWRRVPGDTDRKRKIFDVVLCNDCGIHWLKYGKRRPVVTESIAQSNGNTSNSRGRGRPNKVISSNLKRKRSENENDTIGKKVKEDRSLVERQPISSVCQVCHSMDQPKRLISCSDCHLVVHDDCFGVEKKSTNYWQCDVCKNKKKPSVSYLYQCVLCGKGSKGNQEIMKPTSGYNWAHITCALFIPQVKFINATTMSPIEYAGSIPNTKRKQTCQVCYCSDNGAYLSCSDDSCQKDVHVHCALEQGYWTGFTIHAISSPSSSIRKINELPSKPIVPFGTFGKDSSSGIMIPQIFCPQHIPSSSRKDLYPLTTRTVENKSWISIYAPLYKSIDPNTTPAMRRYAAWCQRNGQPAPQYLSFILPNTVSTNIDSEDLTVNGKKLIHDSTNNKSHRSRCLTDLLDQSCSLCPVVNSPFWWNMSEVKSSMVNSNNNNTDKSIDLDNKLICQRCYCDFQRQPDHHGTPKLQSTVD